MRQVKEGRGGGGEKERCEGEFIFLVKFNFLTRSFILLSPFSFLSLSFLFFPFSLPPFSRFWKSNPSGWLKLPPIIIRRKLHKRGLWGREGREEREGLSLLWRLSEVGERERERERVWEVKIIK